MANHTPGPWFPINIGTHEEPMMSVRAAPILGGRAFEVAICATGDVTQEAEDANTHLIAAAPELLDALTLALRYVETAEYDEFYKP